MFLHFHRQGHIWLRLNIVYMGIFMEIKVTLANSILYRYMHIHGAKTYPFDIGCLNILLDSHKYLVQYMFLHFHRQGHIQLVM